MDTAPVSNPDSQHATGDLTSNRHEVRRQLQRVDKDTEERNEFRKAFQTSFEQGDDFDALRP